MLDPKKKKKHLMKPPESSRKKALLRQALDWRSPWCSCNHCDAWNLSTYVSWVQLEEIHLFFLQLLSWTFWVFWFSGFSPTHLKKYANRQIGWKSSPNRDEHRKYLRNHHQVIEAIAEFSAKLREGFKVFPYRMKVAWSRAWTQIMEMSS